MSENMQSKINTYLLSGLMAVTLAGLGAGLKFWRDISVDVAEIRHNQVTSAGDTSELRARLTRMETESRQRMAVFENECRLKFNSIEIDIIKLKLSMDVK